VGTSVKDDLIEIVADPGNALPCARNPDTLTECEFGFQQDTAVHSESWFPVTMKRDGTTSKLRGTSTVTVKMGCKTCLAEADVTWQEEDPVGTVSVNLTKPASQ
jgi:hypothetical protein